MKRKPNDSAAQPTLPLFDHETGMPAHADAPAPQADALHTPLRAAFDALPAGWKALAADYLASPACAALCAFVDGERAAGKTIYPATPFTALHLTAPEAVKVVIVGQDPYHGESNGIPEAHGLAFSVQSGVRLPPSLRNIFKEIADEYEAPDFARRKEGHLEGWAKQGVLLLNTVLTVEKDRAASHAGRGWEAFTDLLLHHLARQRADGLVFLLWGAHAQRKSPLFAGLRAHLLLQGPHPSPLSAHRGFFGCDHFRHANQWLATHGRAPIDWLRPESV